MRNSISSKNTKAEAFRHQVEMKNGKGNKSTERATSHFESRWKKLRRLFLAEQGSAWISLNLTLYESTTMYRSWVQQQSQSAAGRRQKQQQEIFIKLPPRSTRAVLKGGCKEANKKKQEAAAAAAEEAHFELAAHRELKGAIS